MVVSAFKVLVFICGRLVSMFMNIMLMWLVIMLVSVGGELL